MVAPHFRGLRMVDVSPALVRRSRGAPCATLKSQAHFGFPIDLPAARPKPCSSSHVVTPISGFNPNTARSRSSIPTPDELALSKDYVHDRLRRGSRQQLSWSFFSLRRMNPSESTPPRLASPGTFRPQGFAPSRRFTPRSDLRPCFMPVTPLGFLPSRDFPSLSGHGARHPVDTLLALLLRIPLLLRIRGRSSPHTEVHVIANRRLQGFAPTVNPYCPSEALAPVETADSLLSLCHLSRVLPIALRPRRACVIHSCASSRAMAVSTRETSSRLDVPQGGCTSAV